MRIPFNTSAAAAFGAIVCTHLLCAVPAAAQQSKVAMSSKEIIAACQQRATLTDQWNPLQAERDSLKQTMVNFGFEKIAAAQDNFTDEARQRAHEDVSGHPNRDMFVETLKTGLENKIEALQTAGPISEANMKWLNAASEGNAPLRQAVTRLNQTPLGDRLVVYAGVLKNAGTFFSLYEVATAESSKDMAWKGIMAMAGELPGPWGFLATELEWAGNNVKDAVTGRLMARDIDKMTNMTEENLKQLKQTTERMAVVGKQLGTIRNQLATLPQCDSTQLSNGEKKATDDKPAPPSSGGSIVKPIIVTAALAGAGIAGAQAYSQYKAAQDAAGGSSDGSASGGSSSSSASYRVQVTRTCTPGTFTDAPGVPSTCSTPSSQGGSCGNGTDFTVKVTGGVLIDACGWLSNATVASGTYSGIYHAMGLGVPVSGSFNTSGTSSLSGDGQYEPSHATAVDHVRITITKQ